MDKLDIIFFINLDRSKDRLYNFIQEIKKTEIPLNKVSRFRAVDGNNLFDEKEVNQNQNLLSLFSESDVYFYKNTNNLIAHTLSHFFLYKLIIKL